MNQPLRAPGSNASPGPHPAPIHAPLFDEQREREPHRRSAESGVRGADLAVAAAAVLGATALEVSQQARDAELRNPPIGRFVKVDGIKVHYLDQGSGPPVVLLHGNGTMVQDWVATGLMDRLSRNNRVIAIDRPGYGYSERPRDRLWTAFAQGEFLRRTLRDLDVERPVVVGHSWGTLVSLALALDHPNEVAGLVLLSGYYYPSRRADVWLMSPPGIPVIGDVLRYTISPVLGWLLSPLILRKSFKPRSVPRRFKQDFPLSLSLRPSQIKASAEDSGLMVPGATMLARRYGELRDMPITLVCGEGDKIVTPKDQSVRLHRELPASELRVMPGLGHMLQYFAQTEIVEAVEAVRRKAASPDQDPQAWPARNA